MQTSFKVVCLRCGHHATVDRRPRGSGHWLCLECGEIGLEASAVDCAECGTPIAAARLAAVPGAATCAACARRREFHAARFDEPLGTREDFKRDRSQWRN